MDEARDFYWDFKINASKKYYELYPKSDGKLHVPQSLNSLSTLHRLTYCILQTTAPFLSVFLKIETIKKTSLTTLAPKKLPAAPTASPVQSTLAQATLPMLQ